MDFLAKPVSTLAGEIAVPGDKSISHRVVLLGSIASGTTTANGLLQGDDVLATVRAMRQMGVDIIGPENGVITIQGAGNGGLQNPETELDMGNAGTAMRLLMGLLAGQNIAATMTGDASLRGRPMRRVSAPLALMGANIELSQAGTPPLHIKQMKHRLQGIQYELPVASAQIKSALLFAGLNANGTTVVVEPTPTRDHSERMLRGFGCKVDRNGDAVSIRGGQQLQATHVEVPSDLSSAAFFIVAALISESAKIRLNGIGMNPTRVGVVNILQKMGGKIEIVNRRESAGEPVADLIVSSSRLNGIQIDHDLVALAIDEIPAVTIAAARADGETVISGAQELRVKESDRIAAMVTGLQTLGVRVAEKPDGCIINGNPEVAFAGGEVDSFHDHRVAMSFAIASAAAGAPILIKHCANVATSFPGFTDSTAAIGLQVSVA